ERVADLEVVAIESQGDTIEAGFIGDGGWGRGAGHVEVDIGLELLDRLVEAHAETGRLDHDVRRFSWGIRVGLRLPLVRAEGDVELKRPEIRDPEVELQLRAATAQCLVGLSETAHDGKVRGGFPALGDRVEDGLAAEIPKMENLPRSAEAGAL